MSNRGDQAVEENASGAGSEAISYAGRPYDPQLEYKAMLANASLGIAFTRDRKIFLCNPKFAEMLGWKAEELIGQPGEVLYPSRESYEAMGAIAIPILGSGRQLDIEWEVRRKDGSTFLCRIIAKAIDSAATQQGTIWIAEDITEKKRRSDELARLFREQQAILETASIGICFVKDRRIARCNRRMEEMYGYASGELTGQPASITHAEAVDPAESAAWYEQLARGQMHTHVQPAKRKDGTVFWERASGRAVDPADPAKGSVWLLEDITDQKRAEEELQRLLAEQQALSNNVMVGIAFVRERRIVRCNRRFEELFGYGSGEVLGASTRQFYFTDDEYEQRRQAYEELDAGSTHMREQWLRRKDGSGFWVRISGRAVEPGDGAKGYVWLFEDISERKRADEALRRLVREQDAILQNALIGIVFIRDRKVVRCNHRCEEIFGYGQGELLERSTRFMFACDADYEAGGEPLYEAVWRGETQRTERLHVRKDGSRIWCSVSGRAVQAGDPSQGSVWLFEDITQEHEAEERVRRSLEEQELILENATVGIMFVRDHVIQRCNRRLEEMAGVGPGELLGKNTAELMVREDESQEAGLDAYGRAAQPGTYEAEWPFRRSDGSTFLCRSRGRRIDSGGPAVQWIWSIEDVTLERQAAERVRQALAQQDLILENALVGIAFVRRRVFERCNPSLEQMLGYEPGELTGQSAAVVHVSEEAFAAEGLAIYRTLAEGRAYTAERPLRRKDGSTVWARIVGNAIDPAHPNEGSIWSYADITVERAARESLEASRDALERAVAERTAELQAANQLLEAEIAERKQAETRAQHLADHDALTGLANRRLLEDRLTQALALSQRNRKQSAVMFVDLDRFKIVNDSLGHAVGDTLLKEIAERLVKQLRVGDTICRMGGDEFVVVLPEVKRSSDVANVAQKIIETVSLPVQADDHELQISASVGISVFPDDGRDAETLIRNADAAMYHAKEIGRSNYQFFTEQMNLVASRRLALESDLRRALTQDELRLAYQPIVSLASGALAGHEALVRWAHPSRGMLAPAEFLQLAEDSGLVLRLGEITLREACRWNAAAGGDLPVSVNLSARQFGDARLPELIRRALGDTGLPAHRLELEIAEPTATLHADVALATLRKLKDLGVSLAIDDFGAGHSSLGALKRFPVGKLKIDRWLVAETSADKDARAIVAGMIGLAHALGLKVVAVGVENEPQREFLRGCGCDFAQGYLIGVPVGTETASLNLG